MAQNKKKIYIDAWESGIKGCLYGPEEELISHLSNLSRSVYIKLLDTIGIERKDDEMYFNLTTSDVPVMAVIDFYLVSDGLCIEPNIYNENPDKFEDLIIKLLEALTCQHVSIPAEIELTPKMLETIVRNKNIKTVSLGKRLLTKSIYDMLTKKESIVIRSDNIAPELIEIFDGTIYENLYKKIVDNYSYDYLQTIEKFTFNRIYTEDEIKQIFSYSPKLKSIKIEPAAFANFSQIMKIFGKSNMEITLNLDEKQIYDIQNLKAMNEQYPQVKVKYGLGQGSLMDYIRAAEALEELLKPIEGLELSALEKFIFAFNTCKRFRLYKENEEDRVNARSIIELFKEGNEHIVCAGFANILDELCKRLNIPITKVNLSIRNVSPNNEVEQIGSHARNFVRITDPKYGLDNMYMTDATWSNDYEFDSLVTALMTPNETLCFYNVVDFGDTSVVTAKSYEEFLDSIYIEFRRGSHFNFDKTLEYISNLYPEFLDSCLKYESYKSFKSKLFVNIEDYRVLFSDDNFMQNLFEFIQEKTNKPISGKTLIDASVNLQRKLSPQMTEEELLDYRKKLIYDNYRVYEQQIPAIITEYSDGSKKITENTQNKFAQGPRKL